MSGSSGDTLRSFLVSISYAETGREKFLTNIAEVTKQAVALGVGIAAAAAAVVAGVAKIASSLDALYFAASRSGASVESIKSVQFALSNLGGSAEGALSTLENMGRFLRTNPGSEGFIQSLGVATRDVNGRVRDTGDLLVDLKGKLDKMPFYQASAYAGVLGIDEKTLLANTTDMKAFQETSRQMYAAAGLDATKAAKDSHVFTVELNTLSRAFAILGEKVASVLTKQMSDDIRRFRVWLVSNFDTIGRAIVFVFERFREVAIVMDLIAVRTGDMIRALSGYFLGLEPSTKAAIAAIAGIAAGLLLLNLALSASPLMILLGLVALLGLLVDDYATWMRTGGTGSLIDWSVWEPGIKAAKEGLLAVRDAIRSELWPAIRDELMPALKGLAIQLGLFKSIDSEEFASGLTRGIKHFTEQLEKAILGLTRLLRLAAALARGDLQGAANIALEITDGMRGTVGGAAGAAIGERLDANRGDFMSRLGNLFTGSTTPGVGLGGRLRNLFTPISSPGTSVGGMRIGGTSESTNSATKAAFIAKWGADAQRIAPGLGTSAENILAHWGQETGWGAHEHDNNVGNLQALPGTPGAVTRGDTHANGTAYQAPFFTYPTTAAAADAYAAWMTRHNARTAGTENDPAAYGEALRRAGYMENPNAPGAIAQARRGLVIPLTAAQNATETLERTLHLAPGALRGLGAGTPLGGGSNDNSTTHAPVLNQTTNINVQGAGADTARQVMDGQRSINQDASRALQGGTR